MAVEIRLIDRGAARILAQAAGLDGAGVKVGIRRGQGAHDGTDMLDIAVYNHFGTSTIPARPFVSDCAEKNAEQVQEAQRRLTYRVLQGSLNADDALSQLGTWYTGVQKRHILHGGWTPNAPAAVRRKGSSRPLVDTGQLVNTVDWERA